MVTVIKVLQTKDEWWWQARIVSHPTQRSQSNGAKKDHAGLIPSEALSMSLAKNQKIIIFLVARREKLRTEKIEKTKPKTKKKILGGLFQSGKSGSSKEEEKIDEIAKVRAYR